MFFVVLVYSVLCFLLARRLERTSIVLLFASTRAICWQFCMQFNYFLSVEIFVACMSLLQVVVRVI